MRFGHDPDTMEEVIPVDLGVRWDGGAPLPMLLQSEQRTFLAFRLAESNPSWDGTWVRVVDAADDIAQPMGVIEWIGCGGAVLGGLNDEAFRGHPLWERGLKKSGAGYYGAGEVHLSRWVAEWAEANSVHEYHDAAEFEALRHFILAFHDTTFECVAEGFRSYRARESFSVVARELAARILDDEPVTSRT